MKLLTQDPLPRIFGTIAPPVSGLPTDPQESVVKIVGFGIRVFILVATLTMLIYLLWGAYDWIISGGEKEKITKARSKMTNAVIGLLFVFAMLALYNLVTSDILKIFPNWGIRIPQL